MSSTSTPSMALGHPFHTTSDAHKARNQMNLSRILGSMESLLITSKDQLNEQKGAHASPPGDIEPHQFTQASSSTGKCLPSLQSLGLLDLTSPQFQADDNLEPGRSLTPLTANGNLLYSTPYPDRPTSRASLPFQQQTLQTRWRITTRNMSHGAKYYSLEEIHFIRYFREDCHLEWPAVAERYHYYFPRSRKMTRAGLASRLYRDSKSPMQDQYGRAILDSNGDWVMGPCRIRQRVPRDPFPHSLVEKHPDWALIWDWVKPADKKRARLLIRQLESVNAANMSERQRYQQHLRLTDGGREERYRRHRIRESSRL